MDQTDVALRAVIKALNEVVAPAIDATDFLAQEQLRLTSEYIAFLRRRLPLMHLRERYELGYQLRLAAALRDAGVAPPELAPLMAAGEDALNDARALTADLRALALEAGHIVAMALRRSDLLPAAGLRALKLSILEIETARNEAERVWYAPIGFEAVAPDEASLLQKLA